MRNFEKLKFPQKYTNDEKANAIISWNWKLFDGSME